MGTLPRLWWRVNAENIALLASWSVYAQLAGRIRKASAPASRYLRASPPRTIFMLKLFDASAAFVL